MYIKRDTCKALEIQKYVNDYYLLLPLFFLMSGNPVLSLGQRTYGGPMSIKPPDSVAFEGRSVTWSMVSSL